MVRTLISVAFVAVLASCDQPEPERATENEWWLSNPEIQSNQYCIEYCNQCVSTGVMDCATSVAWERCRCFASAESEGSSDPEK